MAKKIICLSVIYLFLLSIGNTQNLYADSKIAAMINGKSITEEIVLALVNEKLPLISIHNRVSKSRFQEIKTQALNELIKEELLFQESKKRNLTVDTPTLMKQINYMKRPYPSESIFESELEKRGITYSDWVDVLKKRLLIRKLLQVEIIDKIQLSDSDVLSYYQLNLDKFVIPTQLKMVHILISVNPGSMKPGWEAGEVNALAILKRIQEGEDFSVVAKKVSDDTTSRDKGGDIGWLHAGQLLPELDEVALKMELGEVCQPIRTIYGYHILKLVERRNSRQLSFDEINKEKIKKNLFKKQTKHQEEQFVTYLKSQAEIHLF